MVIKQHLDRVCRRVHPASPRIVVASSLARYQGAWSAPITRPGECAGALRSLAHMRLASKVLPRKRVEYVARLRPAALGDINAARLQCKVAGSVCIRVDRELDTAADGLSHEVIREVEPVRWSVNLQELVLAEALIEDRAPVCVHA